MIFYSSVPLGPDFDPTFGPLNFTINNAGFAIAIGTALLWPVVFAPNSLIRTKLGCLAVIALSFYTILFFVGSRSGFLGILVGGMVSAFFAPGARAYVHKIVLVILASSVILLTGYFAYTNQMLPSVINKRAERLLNPLSDGSAMLRVSFAKKAWLLFLDHPIYGGGWGNFLYYEYRQVAPVVVAGHSTRWVGSDTKWPHSIYFKMLSETGLLGTLAFAMLLIWLTASILKVVRWHPGDNSPWVWFFVFLFFSLFHEMMGYLTCVCFALLQGYLIEQLPMAEAKRPPKAKEAAFLPHEQFADRWARSRQ
jgi:O-antigen ligase